MIRRRGVLAGAAGWTIVGASAVRAQAWPNQQIRIVVPYIPGGATDTAGRIVAEKMTALLGQQVIVENRGGGNTIIGMELVAKSKPDGHTLLLGTTTLATNAALGLKQLYDPLKDFQPISTVADIPDIVAIHPSVPAKTLPEFAEWVNKQPQIVRYGTSGVGNQPHLWAELLRARLKLKMENVAYKGVADTLRDVLAGHVPIIIDVVLPTGNHVAAGRLTGLALASAERSEHLPHSADGRRARHEGHGERGILRPGGAGRRAAPDHRSSQRAGVTDHQGSRGHQALQRPRLRHDRQCTPEAYAEKLKFETERWTKVVKDNGIKIEG